MFIKSHHRKWRCPSEMATDSRQTFSLLMMSQYSVVNYWRALKFTARQVKNNNKVYVSSLLPVTTCAKLWRRRSVCVSLSFVFLWPQLPVNNRFAPKRTSFQDIFKWNHDIRKGFCNTDYQLYASQLGRHIDTSKFGSNWLTQASCTNSEVDYTNFE